MSHPLDRAIWLSLTTQQRSLALGDELARRYPAAIAPFAATFDTSAASFESLARLLAPGERIDLCTFDEITPPASFDVVQRMQVDQMVCSVISGSKGATQIVTLGAHDTVDMIALIELTKPGPFGVRTQELGRYLGVRVDDRLAAMAGERMHLDGYTEVSAVCAHPDFRGRGYPKDLILTLSRAIQDRGEIPFLHVLSTNVSAIALYNKLGFARRRTMRLTVLRRAI